MPPANTSSPLAVSTGMISLALEPGKTYEGEFFVINPVLSDQKSYYSVSVGPLNFEDEFYSPSFDRYTDFNQIVDWITVEDPRGSLDPQERRAIKYKITVPEDVPGGGQYASFLVSYDAEAATAQEKNIGVVNRSRIAILLYATVAGETREEGSVIENNVGAIYLDQPIKTSSLIINSGNVHIPAKYTLRIYPLFGDEELYTNEEDPVNNTVIPDTTLYNEKVWEDTPVLGLFRIEQEIDFGDKYNVKSSLALVAPSWFIILCLLFLMAIIYAIIEHIHKIKPKNPHKKS